MTDPENNYRIQRILAIASALDASAGADAAGGSTRELIAAALVVGRPEWMGYTRADGYVDVIAAIDRLGPQWLELARQARNLRL